MKAGYKIKNYAFVLQSLAIFIIIINFSSCEKNDDNLGGKSLTQAEIKAIIKTDSVISISADSALLSPNPEQGLYQLAKKYKTMPQVEDAYFEKDHLAIKYKKGGYVYWLITQGEIDEKQEIPRQLHSLVKAKQLNIEKASGNDMYPKILVVNQHTNDLSRFQYNLWLDEIVKENTSYANIDYIKGNDFNINFLSSKLCNYDGIFILTHGCYDSSTDNTWILTGEEVNPNEFFTYFSHDWYDNKITYVHCTEERNNSNNEDVLYLSVSQKFFNEKYADNSFPNSFFYSGACQTMMDADQNFAKIMYSKGIKKIVGYNEITYTISSILGIYYFINGLCSGNSCNEIQNDLPADLKHQVHIRKNPEKIIWETFYTNLVSYPNDKDFYFDKSKILNNRLNSIISADLIKVLVDMKMPIYSGIEPPKIEGTYLFQPKLINTNITNDFEIGYLFADDIMNFNSQKGFSIRFKSYSSGSYKEEENAVVEGMGKNFTVYVKTRTYKIGDESCFVDLAEIFSGTFENGKISNFSYGFVCVDDTFNDGTFVHKGNARVFVDNDNLLEPTTWNFNKLPKAQYLPKIKYEDMHSVKK
ncbi:MAG: hypothetical protein KBG25_06890 [Paludibacteraceae bacterium]|nr:hypothetical protein [Paludibacteraceae bacterium]MBP8945604.1 hypothetical protein [Paludibacteraceae bacterium]